MSESTITTKPVGCGRFFIFLIVAPIVAFSLTFTSVLATSLIDFLIIPLFAGILTLLVTGMVVSRAGNSFMPRFLVAIPTAVFAVAGFWLPWLVRELGWDRAVVFVFHNPAELFDRIATMAPKYGFVFQRGTTELDLTPYTVEMWLIMTAAFVLAAFSGAFMGGYFRRMKL